MSEPTSPGPTARPMQEFEAAIDRSQTDVAVFDEPKGGPLRAFQGFLHDNPTAAPALVLLLSCAVFGAIAPNFFSAFNLSLIIQQVTVIGILGAAQTLVILTAGIDLSVAAIMVLSYMTMARLAVEGGVPSPLAILIGLAVGAACGLLNGSLATRARVLPILAAVLVWVAALQSGLDLIHAAPLGILAGLGVGIWGVGPAPALRLPPFIVTLGAWSIFFALTLWYSEAQTVRSQDIDAAAPLLKVFGLRVELFGAQFTLGSFLMLGVFVALWYALGSTGWGRSVYAVGDDKEAAELSGIRTDRVLLSVYGVAGFLCALGGWAAIGRVGSASPQSFYEGNLDAITAVVIGGTSLFGGRGAIFGTLIGALIVGVFRSGLKLAGVEVLWQGFAIGLLIIVAVAMDQWIRRVSS
ncbi:MAG: ABC transporter permease [Rubrimonas sp.]|uniref:ABC transporter permease n=1 Tax=Rubrimonas sp. TaxID=2036015 RepID=UPI002FDC8EE7